MGEDAAPVRSIGRLAIDPLMHDIGQPPVQGMDTRRRWTIALVLFGVVVSGFFDRISIAVLFTNRPFNTAMGTLGHPAMLGALMSAFLLAYALSSIFLSTIGDLIGPRRTLAVAASLWGVLMWVAGSCSSFAGLLLTRVVLGASEGPQFSLASKLVERWFPPHERARANAIWMVGSPVGSAIGFPLTIWLVAGQGWRASFYALGCLSIVIVTPLVLAIVRDTPEGAEQATVMPEAHSTRLGDLGALARDPRFWLLAAYGCGLLTYLWGLNSWLPSYLARARGFDLKQMGIYSSLPFILMFICEVSSGLISDRIGRRAILSVIGLFGAGLLMFAATQVTEPHVAAILIAASAGSWGLGLPAQYALAMQIIPRSLMSTGIGVMNGIGNLVGAFAPALIGSVIAMTGSYENGLLVIVIASIAGSLAMLPLVRSH